MMIIREYPTILYVTQRNLSRSIIVTNGDL